MGSVSDVSVFMLLIAFSFVPATSAYYCNHDLCREDQYCCGDNLCCDYVYSLWYFWIGVVFLIVILSACGGFFRYCYDSNSYVILQTFRSDYYPAKDIDDKNLSVTIEDIDAPPPYPGNQYSDTVQKDYQGFVPYEHTGNARSSFHHQLDPLVAHYN